jgi:propionyl-CoA carboxylase alpha chain
MRTSLDQYVIRGLKHNANLCRDVLMQQRYLDGDITTNYLPEQYPNGFKGTPLSPEMKEHLFAVSAIVAYLRQHNEARIQTKMRLQGDQQPAATEFAVGFSEDRKHQSRYLIAREGHYFRVGHGAHHTMKIKVDWEVDQPLIKAQFLEGNGAGLTEYLQWHGTDEVSNQIQYMGTVFNVDVFTENQSKAIGYMLPPKFGGSLSEVTSPMPGVIVSLNVKPGDKIVAGTELLTLEAMKMRNKIRSEVDGTIKTIKVQVGQTVGDGDVLVEFESKDAK